VAEVKLPPQLLQQHFKIRLVGGCNYMTIQKCAYYLNY